MFQSFNSSESEDYKNFLLGHLKYLREKIALWIEAPFDTVGLPIQPLFKKLNSTLKKSDEIKDWVFDLRLQFQCLRSVYGPEIFIETPTDLFDDEDFDF